MDGLPYWNMPFSVFSDTGQSKPMFYPFLPGPFDFDVTKSIEAPEQIENAFIFPQKTLDILQPSTWHFSLQHDDGSGFAQFYETTIASGQFEEDGIVGGTSWEDDLWNVENGTDVESGIVRLSGTFSSVGEFEDLTLTVAVAPPLAFLESGLQKWRLGWTSRYAEAFPGSAVGALRIVYDGETYFATETALRCVLTRTPII